MVSLTPRWGRPFRMVVLYLAILDAGSASRAGEPGHTEGLPQSAMRLLRPLPESEIWSIAFSPDGRLLATGSRDGTVRVWDVGSGEERLVLRGHSSDVSSVAFAADGRILASGGRDATVRLWDATAGKQLRRLEGHQNGICAVAFSPDGLTLASGSDDRTVRLWRTADGGSRHVFQAHRREVLSVAFASDSLTLASGGRDGTVRFWNVASGTQRSLLGDDERKVLGQAVAWVGVVTFSPDGKILALGGRGGTIQFQETTTGESIHQLEGRDEMVSALAFAPDSKTLAWAGGFERTVHVYDLLRNKELAAYRGHRGAVTSAAFAPDGRTLATGSTDGTVLLWDVRSATTSPAPARNLGARELEQSWADLTSRYSPMAYEAMAALTAAPDQSVEFLKERLRPAAGAGGKSIPQLLADLDSDQFAVRDAASRELERLGQLAVPALAREVAGAPTLEVRKRIERILIALEQRPAQLSADDLRHLRAIQILEYIGSPSARQILQALAKGSPLARQTQEATGALTRLDRRSKR